MADIGVIHVKGIGAGSVIQNGEEVSIPFTLGPENENQELNLALPFHMVAPLIHIAMEVRTLAATERSKNPIHAGDEGGLILDLAGLSFGPIIQRPGRFALNFQVQGKGGETTYPISVDRTQLEHLLDSLKDILGTIQAGPPAPRLN